MLYSKRSKCYYVLRTYRLRTYVPAFTRARISYRSHPRKSQHQVWTFFKNQNKGKPYLPTPSALTPLPLHRLPFSAQQPHQNLPPSSSYHQGPQRSTATPVGGPQRGEGSRRDGRKTSGRFCSGGGREAGGIAEARGGPGANGVQGGGDGEVRLRVLLLVHTCL